MEVDGKSLRKLQNGEYPAEQWFLTNYQLNWSTIGRYSGPIFSPKQILYQSINRPSKLSPHANCEDAAHSFFGRTLGGKKNYYTYFSIALLAIAPGTAVDTSAKHCRTIILAYLLC